MVQEVVARQKSMIVYLPRETHSQSALIHDKCAVHVKRAVPPLHIHLLGDFRLVSGEEPVTDFDLPRLQSLLTYLLLHRDVPQSRSQLAFQLWPDSTDAQAYTNLRNLLYRLRNALPNAVAYLHVDRQEVHWSPDTEYTLDVLEFEDALQQAASTNDTVAEHSALERAITLYRGTLLPDCYDEWIVPERDRLHQAYLSALYQLACLLEQKRDYKAAIRIARQLLREEPLQEETYRCLMRLYALNGERASALRVYQACASELERELGIEPAKATREVYERLVQTDTFPSGQKAARVTRIPLVGRQREWTQLQTIWHSTVSGHPHMVVLSGEVGSGKTKVAEEFAAWVSNQGMMAISTQCYTAMEQIAYAPLATLLRSPAVRASLSHQKAVWLTEIVRLVPDLLIEHPELPRPEVMQEGCQQQRFFEALAYVLLEHQQPTLLILDDAQWCDRETLTWLHYFLRFNPQAPLLVVTTVRNDEIVSGNPFMSLLTELRRDGKVSEIELEPLHAKETLMLANQIAGYTLDENNSLMVYRESEGNPLFIVEIVRANMEESSQRGPASARLSSTMQAAITSRLARLSPQARALLNTAAVIGREFTLSVLAGANRGTEEALICGLDELWQRDIIREQAGDSYIFSHEKLRESVLATLSLATRRLLQKRVAEVLEAQYTNGLDQISEQLPVHYKQAVQDQPVCKVHHQQDGLAKDQHCRHSPLYSDR